MEGHMSTWSKDWLRSAAETFSGYVIFLKKNFLRDTPQPENLSFCLPKMWPEVLTSLLRLTGRAWCTWGPRCEFTSSMPLRLPLQLAKLMLQKRWLLWGCMLAQPLLVGLRVWLILHHWQFHLVCWGFFFSHCFFSSLNISCNTFWSYSLPLLTSPRSISPNLVSTLFCLFVLFNPSSKNCAVHILLDLWPWLEGGQLTKDLYIKENWLSHSEKLSSSKSSLYKSRISCVSPLFTLE